MNTDHPERLAMSNDNMPISVSELIEAFGHRLNVPGSAAELEKAGSAFMVSEMVVAAIKLAREHCCESVRLVHPLDNVGDPETSMLDLVLVWPEGSYSEIEGFELVEFVPKNCALPRYPDDWREYLDSTVLDGTAVWDARIAARTQYCEGSDINDGVRAWAEEWSSVRMAAAARRAFGPRGDEMQVSFDCSSLREDIERRTLPPDIQAALASCRITQAGTPRRRSRRLG